MKAIITAFAAAIVLLVLSCNQQNESKELAVQDVQFGAPEKAEHQSYGFNTADTIAEPTTHQKQPVTVANTASQQVQWDKKIIKDAVMKLEVKDFESFNASLRSKITEVGGYVSQEQQNNSEYQLEDQLTIKIPVAQFDYAIELFARGSEKITEKRITSEDVTASLLDTKARMEAKKNIRLRYLELLRQAKKMDEIIQVQREIDEIQEEIEAAQGRIGYLSHASAYSTIHLTFIQVLNPSRIPGERPSFITQVSNAFRTGAGWAGDVFVLAVSIWPLWIFAAVLWMILRRWKSPSVKSA